MPYPILNAHRDGTGKGDSITMADVGLIIPIPGNACIEQQVGALRRIKALHDTVGEDVPVRILLVTDFDAEATRMRTLLLRKAILPTYELWFTNDANTLSRAILPGQLETVLLIHHHKVNGDCCY